MKMTKSVKATCDCGSSLPYGEAHTAERYAHNMTKEHRIAVFKQCGAPQHIIDAEMGLDA
jgi:hypothetical protein